MSVTTPTSASAAQGEAGQNYHFALTSLTFLFFIWGFITCLNDILIPHLKNVFDLTYFQASLVQFCFFGAYFLVSLPAGWIIKKVGYQRGCVIGLSIAAVGCLLFYPAASAKIYYLFLLALFVLASGITILQTAANPYVTALGRPETASSRLTMTQAFNSLGTTLAPQFGGLLILATATAAVGTPEFREQEAAAVQMPYLILAGTLIFFAAVFTWLKLPVVTEHHVEESDADNSGNAWQHSHLVLGAIAIFVYVGAEVAISSYFVNMLAQPEIAGMEESEAKNYLSYFWGGALFGRFAGAFIMQKLAPGKVLAFNSVIACILLLAVSFGQGGIALWSLVCLGLCNSVMFPTIFSLALQGLGKYTSQGSSVLCLAIVGGAIFPAIQGKLADLTSLQLSYLLPILCYLYIMHYGLKGSVPKN